MTTHLKTVAAPGAVPPDPEPQPWRWRGLLAAPFLVCLTVLLATGWTFRTFWDGDEVSHWALIQWFARGLPRIKAVYPYSATTPLFHLVDAGIVRLLGPNLPLVRAFNTLLSIGGVLALFEMLHRTMGHGRATAALLSGVFLSSCFYFGYAFRVLTDNMAIIGCLLAMSELFRFVSPTERRPPLARFLLGCGWLGLTVLTRQSYLFLCLPFAVCLLGSSSPGREKFAGAGAMAVALLPFAFLVRAWGGLVPPDFQVHHAPSPINLYPVALPVMILGLYVPFFFGPDLWRWHQAGRPWSGHRVGPAVGAGILALGVLVFFPLFPVAGRPELTPYFPAPAQEDYSKYFAGSIYALVDRTPRFVLFHNGWLFWFALPLGAAAGAWFIPRAWRAGEPRERLAAWFLLSVLLSSTLNSVSSQKYYDGLLLLFLLWQSRGEAARDVWRRGALITLILGFYAYAAVQPLVSRTRDFQPAPLAAPPPPP